MVLTLTGGRPAPAARSKENARLSFAGKAGVPWPVDRRLRGSGLVPLRWKFERHPESNTPQARLLGELALDGRQKSSERNSIQSCSDSGEGLDGRLPSRSSLGSRSVTPRPPPRWAARSYVRPARPQPLSSSKPGKSPGAADQPLQDLHRNWRHQWSVCR